MATISQSTTQSVIISGGQFTTASGAATFKDQDYGEEALGSPAQLRQFFQQLNPLVQQLNQSSTALNINNLDGEVLSFTVAGIVSDWQALTLGVGTVQNGNTVLTQLNVTAGNAIRKDPYGTCWLYYNVNAAQTLYTLAQQYWPPGTFTQGTISVSNVGVVTSSAATQGIIGWPSLSLSPGQVPGFPVYLQVDSGRTPLAVFILGAKPTTSQSLYSTSTGLFQGPLTGSWNWLSGTAPSYSGTGLSSQVNTVRINNVFGLNTSGAPPNLSYVVTVLIAYTLPGQSSGA